MFLCVGMGFCVVTVCMGPSEQDNMISHGADTMDAIYVGLLFLDAVFSGGKGVILFAVFGLEFHTVIKPLILWVKALRSLYKDPHHIIEDDPRLYHWTLRLFQKILCTIKAK